MPETDRNFEEWAIVEIMGHQTYAGRVSEQALGGTSFVRVDVPEWTEEDGEKHPEFTKLFGAGSIYCITPVSEDAARIAVRRAHQKPISVYMPELYPPAPERRSLPAYDPDPDPLSDPQDDVEQDEDIPF